MNDFSPEQSLFFPETISRLTIEEIEKQKANKDSAIYTGISVIDRVITPMRAGELIPVLGYTSNYKSGLMSILVNNALPQLRDENEVIVVCSWEDSVEDRGIWDLAMMAQLDVTALDRGEFSDSEWKKLLDASLKRAEKPIYWIGHSDQAMRRRPRLSLGQVWKVLDHLYDYHGKKARLIALDYLQRIRPEMNRRDYRISAMENVDQAKDMATAFFSPVLLGTLAGRDVKKLSHPQVPQLEHAQETSNIEQSAGKFFAVCLPCKTMVTGDRAEYGGSSFTVTENLLLVSLLKQKRGPAPRHFAFNVDYATSQLTPYQRHEQNNPSRNGRKLRGGAATVGKKEIESFIPEV